MDSLSSHRLAGVPCTRPRGTVRWAALLKVQERGKQLYSDPSPSLTLSLTIITTVSPIPEPTTVMTVTPMTTVATGTAITTLPTLTTALTH